MSGFIIDLLTLFFWDKCIDCVIHKLSKIILVHEQVPQNSQWLVLRIGGTNFLHCWVTDSRQLNTKQCVAFMVSYLELLECTTCKYLTCSLHTACFFSASRFTVLSLDFLSLAIMHTSYLYICMYIRTYIYTNSYVYLYSVHITCF